MASITTCAASTSSSAGSDTSSSLSYSQTSAYGSRFTGSERISARAPTCRYGATKACRQKDHHGYTNNPSPVPPAVNFAYFRVECFEKITDSEVKGRRSAETRPFGKMRGKEWYPDAQSDPRPEIAQSLGIRTGDTTTNTCAINCAPPEAYHTSESSFRTENNKTVRNQIDCVLGRISQTRMVTQARAYHVPQTSTNHRMVITTISSPRKLWFSKQATRAKTIRMEELRGSTDKQEQWRTAVSAAVMVQEPVT
uniref:Uncharacterized protein n=1 Tax=Branchiostoma floridae TaxID=7739 RepID=C3ZTJ1_BRAFL|eukprot:XP_002588087.1 hypothetical protein BRAFLDRAFT_87604 [Branchiostoma floridae]